MAISPVSASMMSIYVPSLSTSSSDAQKDYEYQLIIQELMAMGIAATGDKTTDKARLEKTPTPSELSSKKLGSFLFPKSPLFIKFSISNLFLICAIIFVFFFKLYLFIF